MRKVGKARVATMNLGLETEFPRQRLRIARSTGSVAKGARTRSGKRGAEQPA